ncbi:Pheophorbide a oxygenase, chloroplastic, partial [Tetrabaena socialis]
PTRGAPGPATAAPRTRVQPSAAVTTPTIAPTVAAPPSTDAAAAAGSGADTFVWTRQWYPCAVIECLDATRPHPFTLLGRDLVLWKDGSGAWRAFEDACPHRLAPLSEGRIEPDGTLLCAYHAWRFDGSGACTSIPQAESQEAVRKACNSPRSCAKTYPTREAQGLLWVWGEPGPAGEAESALKQPALISELEPWFFRDLPYSHDFFIENVTDPAHVNVSHHNVAGNRYAPDQYFDLNELRPVTANGGFKYEVKDQVFLHQQERIVAGRAATSHTAKYFLPAPTDNMTVAFRTWLGTQAGGGIPYAGSRTLGPIDRSKASLFDTFHTHTEQCAVCKPALKNLQTARASRARLTNVSTSSTEFLPPSLVKIRVEYESGAALILALYSSPTIPGHTRHIGRQVLVKDEAGELPRGLAFFAAPMPKWLNHTLASVFLH